MSLINIHNGDYDAKSLFACKGFPSSKHLDLSILGFTRLKAEVNPITRPLPFPFPKSITLKLTPFLNKGV